MKKRNWLIILEYITITGSVVGSIAAFLTKEIVFATTPLTLSLVLNLTNRNSSNIKQQNIANSLQLLTQENKLLDNKLIQLQEKLEIEQNTKNEMIEQSLINIQNIINEYEQKIESIQIQNHLPESEDLVNQSQFIEITEKITIIEQKLRNYLNKNYSKQEEIELTENIITNQEIQNIKNTISKIPQFIQPLEQRLSQLEITYSTNIYLTKSIDDFEALLTKSSIFLEKLSKIINLELNDLEKDLLEINKYLQDAMSAFQILEKKISDYI